MQLTIKDVTKYFNVSARTIYRWINQNAIPVYKLNDQYRFSRAELIEWACSKKIPFISDLITSETETDSGKLPTLHDVISRSGIHYRLEGKNKETVIKNMIDVIKLPEEIDRDFLFQMVMAREKLASTGVGDGIALPHVRNPVILNVNTPLVSICFLEKPVDFGALDNIPVFCLFSVISPSIRIHLHVMSRTAFVLKDKHVKSVLKKQATRAEILDVINKAETAIPDLKK